MQQQDNESGCRPEHKEQSTAYDFAYRDMTDCGDKRDQYNFRDGVIKREIKVRYCYAVEGSSRYLPTYTSLLTVWEGSETVIQDYRIQNTGEVRGRGPGSLALSF
jgi:hypothetical protein